ncbi:MAG: hypothetical protein WCF90_05420 [Methanomicrobiales archaeon]
MGPGCCRNARAYGEIYLHVDIHKIKKKDVLFIRARADPLNITYVAVQMAWFHEIMVLDHPESIRCCSDKINMYSRRIKEKVSLPKTVSLPEDKLMSERGTQLFDKLGTPLVVKDP